MKMDLSDLQKKHGTDAVRAAMDSAKPVPIPPHIEKALAELNVICAELAAAPITAERIDMAKAAARKAARIPDLHRADVHYEITKACRKNGLERDVGRTELEPIIKEAIEAAFAHRPEPGPGASASATPEAKAPTGNGKDKPKAKQASESQRETAAKAKLKEPPPIPDEGEQAKVTPDEKPPPKQEEKAADAEVVSLRTVSAATWAGKPIPSRRWIVMNRLLRGTVAILSGDGGIGKTTIALQLAVGVVLDFAWLNAVVEASGPVLFFSAEETKAEIWRRLAAIAEHHGRTIDELTELHVFSCLPDDDEEEEPTDPILGAPDRNRTIQPTPLYTQLTARALEIKPALIIIEAAADVFGGNEIVRSEVRQFMGLLRRLACKSKSAVLLLQHPSQSGMREGTGTSGSRHWNNAARPRLYFSADNDDDVRELQVMKTNYGRKGEIVQVRWQHGVFIPIPAGTAIDRAAAETPIDDAFLRCLDAAIEQGRRVSPNPSASYAPAVFESMPEANGIKNEGFKRAMARLLSAKRIEIISTGPHSRQTKQLARPKQ